MESSLGWRDIEELLQMCLALLFFWGQQDGVGKRYDGLAPGRSGDTAGQQTRRTSGACGAGLRKPMEEIAVMFQEEAGILVNSPFEVQPSVSARFLPSSADAFFLGMWRS